MELVGKALQPRFELIDPVRKAVVGDHRGDRGEQPDRGGEQRFGDPRRDNRERRVLLLADLEERIHDPPDGAEQPDKRCHRAHRGEEIEPFGEPFGLQRDRTVHRRRQPLARAFLVKAFGADRAAPFGEARRSDFRRRHIALPAFGLERVDILGLPEIAFVGIAALRHRRMAQAERDDDRPDPDRGKDQPGHDQLDNNIRVDEQLERIKVLRRLGGGRGRSGGKNGKNGHAFPSTAIGAKAARQPSGIRRGRPSGATKPTRNVASDSKRPSS